MPNIFFDLNELRHLFSEEKFACLKGQLQGKRRARHNLCMHLNNLGLVKYSNLDNGWHLAEDIPEGLEFPCQLVCANYSGAGGWCSGKLQDGKPVTEKVCRQMFEDRHGPFDLCSPRRQPGGLPNCPGYKHYKSGEATPIPTKLTQNNYKGFYYA